MTPKELSRRWPAIEHKLEVGDILLFHKRKGPISKLIRARSHSYWNHTAMVFKDTTIMKIGGPLIIEAFKDGIEIHRLRKYAEQPEMYDIGVKRYPKLNVEERVEITKGFMLSNIDVPYDYGRLFAYLFGTFFNGIPPVFLRQFQKRLVRSDAFICSSFIHKTYHNFERHGRRQTSTDRDYAYLQAEELWTPGDISRDRGFTWIFNKHEGADE